MQTTRLTVATALAALFWMAHAGAALAQDAEGAPAEHVTRAEVSSSSDAARDEESTRTVSSSPSEQASPPPLSEPAPGEPWERAPSHPRPRYADGTARVSEPAQSRRAQARRSSNGWIAPVVIVVALAVAAGLVALAVVLGDALSGLGSIGGPSYPLRAEASPPSAAGDVRLGVSPLAGGAAASFQLTF